jgi:type IV secretory pathway component VirB8
MEYFNELVNFNNKLSTSDKDGYKSSNIIIDSIQNISDTIAIINYSNTFKNTPDKIKLVRVNKEWLVDFKYTFSGN